MKATSHHDNLLPIAKRIMLLEETQTLAYAVQIGFRDAKLQRLFNDHESLQARFGPTLATRIASRMGLLKAAPRLSFVPRDAPVLLTPVDGSLEDFTVTLTPGRRLKFSVRRAAARRAEVLDLDTVAEIEICSIEQSTR